MQNRYRIICKANFAVHQKESREYELFKKNSQFYCVDGGNTFVGCISAYSYIVVHVATITFAKLIMIHKLGSHFRERNTNCGNNLYPLA